MHAEEEIRKILRQGLPLPHYKVKRLADLLRRNGVDPFDLAGILDAGDKFAELCGDLRRLHPVIHPDLLRLKAAERSIRQLKRRASDSSQPRGDSHRPSLCQEMWWEWGVIFPPFEFMIRTKFTKECEVRAAVIHVLEVYPVLRASFSFNNGRLELVINDSATFVLESSQSPIGSTDPGPSPGVTANSTWGAPIANDAPWQIRIVAMLDESGRYILEFNIGHMIFDNASVEILVKNIERIFYDLSQDLLQAHPVDHAYFDIARPEREWMENGEGAALLDYWKAALDGFPAVVSPGGRRLEHWQRGLSAHCPLAFDQSIHRCLANIARERKVSLLVVVVYLITRAVSRWCCTDDIVIRNLRNKRDSIRTRDMVGFWTAADIICLRGINRSPTEVIHDIALSLDCARRLNLPQQPGDWLRIQKTIPVTLNYMVDAFSDKASGNGASLIESFRGKMSCHMSSSEQADKPNVVISMRDSGRTMQASIIFSGVSCDCVDEDDLVDIIFEEFTKCDWQV